MSRLYVKIVELALAGADIGHGREGFYFGENGEHTMYDIAKAMGAALKDMGLASTAEPSSFTKEELDKYFNGVSVGTAMSSRRTHRNYSLTGSFCDSPRAWERTSAVERTGPAA